LIIEIADKDSPMNKNREITQFSDSIIISFLINEKSEVFHTLIELLHLTMELLRYGFVIRGGISLGKCFHNNTRVFGPAIIKAVELEKKAENPRIIIEKKVLKKGCENHANHHRLEDEYSYLMDLVKQDDDGEWYLNYFSPALNEVDNVSNQFYYIENLKSFIQNNLDKYCNNDYVLKKYEWMKKKYNEMINLMKSKANIDRFKDSEPKIAVWLESVSVIN